MRTIVQLGRYGDILTLIPAIIEPTRWAVAPEFADILQGIPNIEVQGWPAPLEKPPLLGDITQVYCNPQPWSRDLSFNFQHEMWLRFYGTEYAKTLHDLTNRPLKVGRLPAREKMWLDNLIKDRHPRPILLVNLNSFSSPLPWNQGLYMEEIRKRFESRYLVWDISQMRAPLFVMMLALLEHAQLTGGALLTADTGLLHLAYACGIRTFALVNNDPWLASMPRKHWVGVLPYSRALDFTAIEEAL